MVSYRSLRGETVTEKVIEKSRFITTSRHVSCEEEACAFIAEISAKYRDATHNCHAYIYDRVGNFPRFSDDGEPQGTAGMPILEVKKKKKLFETAVVVTRYFGGIKLGAGGLVRAYSSCTAENLDAAEKVLYENCSESSYTVAYTDVDSAMRLFAETGASVLSADYSNEVIFIVAVKKSEEEDLNKALLNRLCGRVKIRKIKEYFYPFDV